MRSGPGRDEVMKLMHIEELNEAKNLFLTAIRTRLLMNHKSMEREMDEKGKPATKELLSIIRDVCSKVEGEHQRKAFYDTAVFFLFIYHRDSCYHYQGNYALYRLLSDASKILPMLEAERQSYNFLDPKTWGVNIFAEYQKRKKL